MDGEKQDTVTGKSFRYLPFLQNGYTVAPALTATAKNKKAEDRLLFQIDEHYNTYINNKRACRSEHLAKYFLTHNLATATAKATNSTIIHYLTAEYPQYFSVIDGGKHKTLYNKLTGEELTYDKDGTLLNCNYYNLFDALLCQIQEDVAICQLANNKDWLTALHICSPNHWSPADKVGKPFNKVHAHIPGMEKTNANYTKMLQAIVTREPFTRFAWGISTDNRLNHHPLPPPGYSGNDWQGRQLIDAEQLFVRVERQNLIGLPAANAFIFTIRTYFYSVQHLHKTEKQSLMRAINNMSTESLVYKGLWGQKEEIIRFL